MNLSELEIKLGLMLLVMLILNIILIKILNILENKEVNEKLSYNLINNNMKYSLYIIITGIILIIIKYIYSYYYLINVNIREYNLSYLINIIFVLLFGITGIHGFINKKNIKDSTFNQWNNVTLIAFILLLFNLLLFFIGYYK